MRSYIPPTFHELEHANISGPAVAPAERRSGRCHNLLLAIVWLVVCNTIFGDTSLLRWVSMLRAPAYLTALLTYRYQ